MKNQTANLDYCGIVILLRQLVSTGVCTETEARKIAARIGVNLGITIIISL